ncbi:MAG: glycosyltransferase [Prolixibacteraceae bacterium]|nr:glycosyltransferase [Prolixibacteraceae bacterium]
MNILMILDEEFPPDSRVLKEINSLVDEGFYVFLICSTFEGRPTYEKHKGWELHRLRMAKIPWRKLKATVLIIPFYFWRWKYFILKRFKNVKFNAVHVHDLPLSKIGEYVSKKKECALILDQHEYYSDWIVKTAHMNTFIGRIVKFFTKWKEYERKHLNSSDLVITVTEPLRLNYIKEYCLQENKIITIPNTPNLDIFNEKNIKKEIVEKYKDKFILFYAGGIDVLRGIDIVINSLPELRKIIPNIMLLLAGKIRNPYDPFQRAKEVGCSDLLEFVGWIDENDLPSYIKASDVCFFTPNPDRDEINNTIATKNYQYAAMKKPQIVSSAKMMSEFVVENNLGYSINNSKEFTEKVIDIYKEGYNVKTANNKSIKGWSETIVPLLQYYKNLGEN